MAVPSEIEAILQSPCDSKEDVSQCEAIEKLIPKLGWHAIRSAMIEVLATARPRAEYQVAMEVIWGAVCDKREMPEDRIIALLYHRFDPHGNSEDNLVWSITCRLKKVGYMSEYSPFEDPGVKAELAAIRGG
jgi:hypothetical protein